MPIRFSGEYAKLQLGDTSGFGRGHAELMSLLGKRAGSGFLRSPAGEPIQATILNTIGSNAQYPSLSAPHSGIDFAVPSDTLLLAPADGQVETGGGGAYLRWRGSAGAKLDYSHASPYGLSGTDSAWSAPDRSEVRRRSVKRGEVIGGMGRVWGTPHYHIDGNEQGFRALDPLVAAALDSLSAQARLDLAESLVR